MLSPRSVQPGGFEARETREKRSAPAAQCSVAVDVRLIGRACSHCQPAFQKTYKWLRHSYSFPANSPDFPATYLLASPCGPANIHRRSGPRKVRSPRRVTDVIANPAKARGPAKRKKINSADRRHSSSPSPPGFEIPQFRGKGKRAGEVRTTRVGPTPCRNLPGSRGLLP